MTYGLPFYGIVWILVKQRPFMDSEFGNEFLGLFGNTFRLGLASCESRFIIYYFLCFIYLYIYVVFFFFFLFLIFFGFYTERCHQHATVPKMNSVGEFIFGTVACWWHAIVSTMKYTAPLQGCFLWGSVFPVKTMVSLCFCLKWTSPRTLDTFLALFITHLCCSN